LSSLFLQWIIKTIIFATVTTGYIIQGKAALMDASGATWSIVFLFFFIVFLVFTGGGPIMVSMAIGDTPIIVSAPHNTFNTSHFFISFSFCVLIIAQDLNFVKLFFILEEVIQLPLNLQHEKNYRHPTTGNLSRNADNHQCTEFYGSQYL
jgi:hypothetical protein